MATIHIKNLEAYQPKYKDGRRLLWIRWDIAATHDYKIHKLSPAQRWLFIGLICAEVETRKPLPWDEKWIADKLGFQKNHIHKDLLMLQTLELIVTDCNNNIESPSPTYIQTDNTIHTDNTNNISQAGGLLKQFSNALQEKIKVYIDRVKLKNKSKVITEGRQVTLLTELWNSKERCADDTLFTYAVDMAVSYDACCIGYVNKVWANKKAGKP